MLIFNIPSNLVRKIMIHFIHSIGRLVFFCPYHFSAFKIVIAINQSSVENLMAIFFHEFLNESNILLYNIFPTHSIYGGNECNDRARAWIAYERRERETAEKKKWNKIRWIDGVRFCSVHWHWYDWENSNRSEWLALNTRAWTSCFIYVFICLTLSVLDLKCLSVTLTRLNYLCFDCNRKPNKQHKPQQMWWLSN